MPHIACNSQNLLSHAVARIAVQRKIGIKIGDVAQLSNPDGPGARLSDHVSSPYRPVKPSRTSRVNHGRSERDQAVPHLRVCRMAFQQVARMSEAKSGRSRPHALRIWLVPGTLSGVTSCRRLSAAIDRPGLEGRIRMSLRSSGLRGVASPAGLTRGSIFFARRSLKWDGLPGHKARLRASSTRYARQ
jgi:hypothetical protein